MHSRLWRLECVHTGKLAFCTRACIWFCSVQLNCFYFTAELNGMYIKQLPDPLQLSALLANSDPVRVLTQYVETSTSVVITDSTVFTLYMTAFIRDGDATNFFNAIRSAYVSILSK